MEGLLLLLSLFAAEQRPNVIRIMVDDFGCECVTANGGESYQTPNLDQLAAPGVRFENCHSQPLRTPTRVQLMTGRYNVRNYLNFGTLRREGTTFGHLLKNREKPFFLDYLMILTHNPFQPTPDSPNWDPTISSARKQQDPKHVADMTA